MRILLLTVVALAGLVSTGCGSIVNGMKQDIAITSSPGGATVTVDGVERDSTPIVVPLSRKHAHVVKVEQPGYAPVERSITTETSDWVWGNILFGGLIGLAVDSLSGGMHELGPEQVHANFPMLRETRVSGYPVSMPCPTTAATH
jgi:hypothetical protein